MLLTLVFAYLAGTIAIGLWAARRVHNTADFTIAGRHLPLVMIVTTCFATWFGSETVLGIPAKFVAGAFVPLVAGLYWPRATTQGALLSMVLGPGTWALLSATAVGEQVPAQLAGVCAAAAGMLLGSLAPQRLADRRGTHHAVAGAQAA